MITWFDALLVTLLAAIMTMGIRRGLAGAVWAVFALLAMFIINATTHLPVLALVLALLLGYFAAWGAQRLIQEPVTQAWQLVAGGLGGALLGVVLVAALALSFPLRMLGSQGLYPSTSLPTPLYYAVYNSYIVSHLAGVWASNRLVRTLLAPDRMN